MTRQCFVVAGLLTLTVMLASGCGWLGAGAPPQSGTTVEATPAAGDDSQAVADAPSVSGVLDTIAAEAPPGSPSQHLARLAAEFGWEDQVSRNEPLKRAVEAGEFDERVESYLLALYYRNGFSVLPVVGEGHEFARDSVVRGALASARLLVTTREPIRIVFLGPAENVQIVYPQDGAEPQIYAVQPTAVVAVRESLLEHYLR